MVITTDILKIKANTPMEKADQLVQLEAIKKGIDKKIKEYKADLLKATQELDVLQLKTGKYTISRVSRVTPRVLDFETLKESLEKAHIPYDTQETFSDHMRAVFTRAVKEGKQLDGLDALETEYVMVRIAKK